MEKFEVKDKIMDFIDEITQDVSTQDYYEILSDVLEDIDSRITAMDDDNTDDQN